MALLTTGLLDYFLPIFSFLLVFVISYALLMKTKILGEDDKLNLLAALAVSILFLFTPEATQIIKIATPWFVIFLLLLTLIFATFLFLGIKQETMTDVLKDPVVRMAILVIIIGIFLFAFVQIFGSPIQALYGGPTSEEGASGLLVTIGKILFHPRLLGAVFILVMAAAVIRLIVGLEKK